MAVIRTFLLGFLLTCALAIIALAPRAQAEPSAGPTVLTVAGNISKPNRGAVDPFVDAFFSFSDVQFDRAAAFDLAALQALGMKKLTVRYPDWPRGFTFEGPLLRDVLTKAGASGSTVRIQALDGYFAEIPMADVQRYPILLAVKRDGTFIGLGDRGPAWVVFPRDDHPELAARDDAQWVWSAYFISVQ